MLNTPINASDPTGHKCSGEIDECLDDDGNPINGADKGGMGGGDPYDQDDDGVPDVPNPYIVRKTGTAMDEPYCSSENTVVECFYNSQVLLIDGQITIEADDFNSLLFAIFYDIKAHELVDGRLKRWDALKYDTPFFDYGKLGGKVCVSDQCYSRSEVNYIAQGMISASNGLTLAEGEKRVYNWKKVRYPNHWFDRNYKPTPGTYYWHKAGYDFYTTMNPYYKQLVNASNP